MMPFFSVVIPVYNRAHLIEDTIRSVLVQTDQDFEIVVVDDGSRDDPGKVVAAMDDPRIDFVRQENRGGGAARNTGIDRARGRYIAFLDSDDHFLPHHLATMRGLLESGTFNFAYGRIIVDRGGGRTITKPPRAIRPGEDMAVYLLCDRGFVPTSTMVVAAPLARKVRFHEALPPAEDTDFAIRAALAGAKFVMADTPSAVWRDIADAGRLSAGRRGASIMPWLDALRPQIPAQAYHGCRGWAYAKYVATQNRGEAFRLWLNAVRRGCYRPSLAAIIFLQIFLSDGLYRRVANAAIKWLGAGWQRKARSG
jgi:glycosyltransferase involved in cell wall biosynthesis